LALLLLLCQSRLENLYVLHLEEADKKKEIKSNYRKNLNMKFVEIKLLRLCSHFGLTSQRRVVHVIGSIRSTKKIYLGSFWLLLLGLSVMMSLNFVWARVMEILVEFTRM